MAFYLSRNTVNVTLLGDSIVDQMASNLATFPEPFDSSQELGVGGEVVSEIAARTGSISGSATHVVIIGGTNDLVGLNDESGIIPGYTTILAALTPARRVIVVGIPPVDEAALEAAHPGWTAYLNNERIHNMNVQIANLCREYENCVAAVGVMAQKMDGFTTDGIHPTAAGQLRMITKLLPLLGH